MIFCELTKLSSDFYVLHYWCQRHCVFMFTGVDSLRGFLLIGPELSHGYNREIVWTFVGKALRSSQGHRNLTS